MDIKSGYYSNSRNEVQDFVKQDSRFILDVGCGTGIMSGELKTRLNAEVWGIEISEEAAFEAKKRLDKVLSGAVEELYKQLPDKYFDTIIFADVLEHLIDPYTLLKEIVSKLQISGEIIASIPNINYWGVIQSLLQGEFRYSDSGILDRTHLRFFTRTSIYELFRDAGLYIIELNATPGNAEPIPEIFLNACKSINIDTEKLKTESFCFQYLVKAVRSDLYENILREFAAGHDYLNRKEYKKALEKFKVVRGNFRKYNDIELFSLKPEILDTLIEKIEKI